MPNLDTSDLAVIAGAVVLAGGLLWVHPGWLVAMLGAALLSRTIGRP